MTPVLTAKNIFKSYDALAVLKDVSLRVEPGTTHALIGPNGAGKTTLFKVLSGEVLADEGRVTFLGRDISREPGFRRVRLGIGRTFQVARIFSEISVFENMVVALEAGGNSNSVSPLRHLQLGLASGMQDEAMHILGTVGLVHRRHELGGVLAYGERKRLELALALALKPQMLLLDEPMAGMSPGDRAAAAELLVKISRELSMSILLTEHDMNVVFALADRISVLNYGELIASGTPQEVKASAIVREVYLGQEHA